MELCVPTFSGTRAAEKGFKKIAKGGRWLVAVKVIGYTRMVFWQQEEKEKLSIRDRGKNTQSIC